MMKLIQQYQSVIAFVLAVAVLYAVYQFFFAPTDAPVLVATEAATGADNELLALLFQLRGIRLDTAIFEDPNFRSLSDFSLELVPEPIGRPNPFAPLGAGSVR